MNAFIFLSFEVVYETRHSAVPVEVENLWSLSMGKNSLNKA